MDTYQFSCGSDWFMNNRIGRCIRVGTFKRNFISEKLISFIAAFSRLSAKFSEANYPLELPASFRFHCSRMGERPSLKIRRTLEESGRT